MSMRTIREKTVGSRGKLMRTISAVGLWAGLSLVSIPVLAQISPCDLNQDGVVNAVDVQSAIEMTLGSVPCTANIDGAGVCNVAIVQRVVNAALGGACRHRRGGLSLITFR